MWCSFFAFTPDYWLGLWSLRLPVYSICQFEGVIKQFLSSYHLNLQLFMSIIVYLRCCHNVKLALGKFDYKLHLGLIIFNSIIAVMFVLMDVFGPNLYWCFVKTTTSDAARWFTALLYTSIFVTILFCHHRTRNRIQHAVSVESARSPLPLNTHVPVGKAASDVEIAVVFGDEQQWSDMGLSSVDSLQSRGQRQPLDFLEPMDRPSDVIKWRSMRTMQRYLLAQLLIWVPVSFSFVLNALSLRWWWMTWITGVCFASVGYVLGFVYFATPSSSS